MPEGILGRKLGMTRIFDQAGNQIPVTVIQAGPCTVLRKKTKETDGYTAIQLAFDPIREKLLTKPLAGEFHKRGVETMRVLQEFRLDEAELAKVEEGQLLTATMFKPGEKIDVIGTSRGSGFSGVMKRHNFKGGKATHGVHECYRHGGSIGTSATPSHVLKGRKMAGQHGNSSATVHNATIVAVNAERNLILVKGGVPGAPASLVTLRRGIKRRK